MTDDLWQAGFGKADITVFEPGMLMFGWAHPDNIARDVAAPLHARALALRCPRSGAKLVYVCAELGFISQHLRTLVLARVRELELDEHVLMLTATHTHSGPNGYSGYLMYGVSGPGFSKRVAEGLADGIVRAIRQALERLRPAHVYCHAGSIPLVEPVAFNRALSAYNLNRDVEPVSAGRSDEAVDRRVTVLRVDTPCGRPRGMIAWFSVHGTSVHSDNTRIHPDNKGIASSRCERYASERWGARAEPFVAMFAQECAGDVTPNFRWDPRRKRMVGGGDDDFANAELVGGVQARVAFDLMLGAAEAGERLSGELAGRLRYSNFSSLAVDPDFAFGRYAQRTTRPCLGLGFAIGTDEGPGPAFAMRGAQRALSALVRRTPNWSEHSDWRAMHGAKLRFFDLGLGSGGHMLGWLPRGDAAFRWTPDDRVKYYARVRDDHARGERPWVPEILPIQLFRLGALCVAGLPVEPTTHAGRRLRAALQSTLVGHGVKHALVNGYANAYASYVTTYEEYQLQLYEGASTLFGPWTQAAFSTELRKLARDLVRSASASSTSSPALDLVPPHFGDDPLPSMF